MRTVISGVKEAKHYDAKARNTLDIGLWDSIEPRRLGGLYTILYIHSIEIFPLCLVCKGVAVALCIFAFACKQANTTF